MQAYKGTKTLENMNQAKFYNQWTLSKFVKYLKGDILEVGCGIGNFTQILSKFGDITAIDIDESLIRRFDKHGSNKITAGYGDIEKDEYFFKEKTFDTIVCVNVLEHISDDKKALQNMYKLLKKEGKLILLVPIYDFLYGEIDKAINHFRRYKPGKIQKQLESIGFSIESGRKLNFLGALGWFVAGRILKEQNVEEKNIKIFNLFAPLILRFENLIEPPIGTSILIIAKKS
ncbi:MAG: class I SAM-dependent methyltransferase [Actinobacteria bacterium]|nr:class I SAM-dependent methyltransferase [Actinomycetota bacterium]